MEGMRMKWASIVSDMYHRPILRKEKAAGEEGSIKKFHQFSVILGDFSSCNVGNEEDGLCNLKGAREIS